MDMTGDYRIEAPRQKVWEGLNDPEVLKQCIPGCEELTKDGDDSFSAKVKMKIGPVSAKFSGTVTLSDIVAPESYTISGEGKGGAAGFAKGGAKVRLAEDGAATKLSYQVNAQVGGKLAQIGSRLIDGSAKKLAGQFFESFASAVSESAGPTAPAVEASLQSPPPPDTAPHDAAVSRAAPAPQASPAKPDSPAEDDHKHTEVPNDEAVPPPAPSSAAPTDLAAGSSKRSSGLRPSIWVTALIVAIGILLLIFAV